MKWKTLLSFVLSESCLEKKCCRIETFREFLWRTRKHSHRTTESKEDFLVMDVLSL